ncbi:MAG: hypothetical protein OES38_09295 [Gammaproteobacteria bacterium]|nr:hypothetical protein [Gammaproteobacteria bacterium]
MFDNLLRFANFRYFWWFLASLIGGWVLYASHNTTEPPNGGTWQGYVLGTWAALLIVLLALLGFRKRAYRSRLGSTQGWTSAHVYLGVALWFLATLHCAAQFGWNVHTLAYALMCLVIISGMFGVYTYLNYPRRMTANRTGSNRSELFAELYELNRQGADLARNCAADIQTAVLSSIERTTIGGSIPAQLTGRDGSRFETLEGGARRNTDQEGVIEYVSARIPKAEKRAEVTFLQDLLAVLCRRQAILRRLRQDVRFQGWLKAWLYVHVPITAATVVALTVHIVTTFIYW